MRRAGAARLHAAVELHRLRSPVVVMWIASYAAAVGAGITEAGLVDQVECANHVWSLLRAVSSGQEEGPLRVYRCICCPSVLLVRVTGRCAATRQRRLRRRMARSC